MFVQLVEVVTGGIGPEALQDAEMPGACSFPDRRPAEERLLVVF
jgi:hypothetical protein